MNRTKIMILMIATLFTPMGMGGEYVRQQRYRECLAARGYQTIERPWPAPR